jgi:uncharacterized protein
MYLYRCCYHYNPNPEDGGKMLEFETPAGNMYAWDDEKGLFIPFSPTMSAVMNEFSNQETLSKEKIIAHLKEKFNIDEIAFCYDWLKKWEKIKLPNYKSQIPQNVDISNVKNYILVHCLSQLTLCVTEDCNFRCKYCTFSDFYEYNRGYSNKYMDFIIAKKAIDCYLSLLEEGKRYNPLRKPVIGFYGGEPLLNFKLIKTCVEYIENKYSSWNVLHVITTNGSLLDREKANWFMEHDFVISISLDGPEAEHNRLRVYSNGRGTFSDVIENISPMMEARYKEIYSLPVFDWKSDLFKREEFFIRKDIPPVARASLVTNVEGCKYYEQFTKEDYLAFLGQLEMARTYYFKDLNNQIQKEKASFFDKLVGQIPGDDLFNGISIYPPPPIMPLTGACVPGRKMFVDVNGNYHVCERVNNAFPIGNVDEGLNFEKIGKLISDYISHMDKCLSCKVSRKCTCCYQTFTTDKEFSYSSKVCEKIESFRKDSFVKSFSIAESNPEFVEETDYRYKNVKKHYGE